VLPFADLSPGKDQDWFCDGIAEEILNALTQLPGLHVAARASAFSLRNNSADLPAIAEKLRVATVLQGSVRRAGDRVRVTVQLVDVTNGFQLWSERYDRELKDIFDVQDEIARAVAERLRVTLADASQRLVVRATTNLDAYELLLKGRVLLIRRGRAIFEAQACFEQALALDPGFAEAHALLGDAYRLIGLYGLAPATEMMPRARAAAERALSLDPRQVEALATLASVAAVYDWDTAASSSFTDRALSCDPSHVRASAERAAVLAALEPPTPAIVQLILRDARRARELDPLNAWVVAIEAWCLFLTDRAEEAAATAYQAVALDRENFTAKWVLVFALAACRRYDECLAAAEPALSISGRNPRILTEIAAVHAARGNREDAETIYQELRNRAASAYVGFSEQGAAAASAGRLEEARALVRQGIDGHEPFLAFWKLPSWGPYRADAQGMALLRTTALFRPLVY
jgi:TolB-like protein